MFCYNFMRTKNILGFEKMLQAIQNWQSDYSKVVCDLKTPSLKPFTGKMNHPVF